MELWSATVRLYLLLRNARREERAAFLLLPFVRMTTEYVRDGDAMNVLLYDYSLGPGEFLVTYDIVNLYPRAPKRFWQFCPVGRETASGSL